MSRSSLQTTSKKCLSGNICRMFIHSRVGTFLYVCMYSYIISVACSPFICISSFSSTVFHRSHDLFQTSLTSLTFSIFTLCSYFLIVFHIKFYMVLLLSCSTIFVCLYNVRWSSCCRLLFMALDNHATLQQLYQKHYFCEEVIIMLSRLICSLVSSG